MSPDDVRARLARIEQVRATFGAAHGDEDDLRRDVLAAIAGGAAHALDLAALALETPPLPFPRYVA